MYLLLPYTGLSKLSQLIKGMVSILNQQFGIKLYKANRLYFLEKLRTITPLENEHRGDEIEW